MISKSLAVTPMAMLSRHVQTLVFKSVQFPMVMFEGQRIPSLQACLWDQEVHTHHQLARKQESISGQLLGTRIVSKNCQSSVNVFAKYMNYVLNIHLL